MCSLPQANWRTVSLCVRIDRWKTRHKLRGKSLWFSAGHALMAKSSALSRSLWGVVILLWGVVISLDTQGGSKNLCFVQVSLRCGNLAFGCSNVGCSHVVRHTGLSILTEQYLLIHWYLRNNVVILTEQCCSVARHTPLLLVSLWLLRGLCVCVSVCVCVCVCVCV